MRRFIAAHSAGSGELVVINTEHIIEYRRSDLYGGSTAISVTDTGVTYVSESMTELNAMVGV